MQGRLLGTYLGEPQLLRKPAEVGGCVLKNQSIDVGRDFGEIIDDLDSNLGGRTQAFLSAEPPVDLGTDEEDFQDTWCEVLNQIF